MKFIQFILSVSILLAFTCNHGQSQQAKPEKVLRIVYEIKSNEWYEQQAKLWKKELEKNPKNPEAWVNYYNANRYAHFENIDTEEKQAKLAKIIEDMGKAIPGTFEYYLFKHRNKHDLWDVSILEKAYQLQPDRPETFDEFITHYEATGKEDKVSEFYEKWYKSKDISPWLLNYNYNVLMSLEQNAILFTNGDNDTYPERMLQEVKGVREDVTVINIPMSWVQPFIERKLKEKDITIDIEEFKQKIFDSDLKKPASPIHRYIQELAKMLAEKYPEMPIYFALTVYEHHIKDIKDDLYIVGLAYRYSSNRIDNLALLKKNLEKNFRLDYLKYDWYNETYPGKRLMAQIQMNYVAPMIMLAEHYKKSGEEGKAHEWKNRALELAKQAGNKKAVKDIEKKGL